MCPTPYGNTPCYQVLKKWLSDREKMVLGRDITKDEAREFTHIVRRIAALLLLEPKLDKNYVAIKTNCYSWTARIKCLAFTMLAKPLWRPIFAG